LLVLISLNLLFHMERTMKRNLLGIVVVGLCASSALALAPHWMNAARVSSRTGKAAAANVTCAASCAQVTAVAAERAGRSAAHCQAKGSCPCGDSCKCSCQCCRGGECTCKGKCECCSGCKGKCDGACGDKCQGKCDGPCGGKAKGDCGRGNGCQRGAKCRNAA